MLPERPQGRNRACRNPVRSEKAGYRDPIHPANAPETSVGDPPLPVPAERSETVGETSPRANRSRFSPPGPGSETGNGQDANTVLTIRNMSGLPVARTRADGIGRQSGRPEARTVRNPHRAPAGQTAIHEKEARGTFPVPRVFLAVHARTTTGSRTYSCRTGSGTAANRVLVWQPDSPSDRKRGRRP